MLPHFRKCVRDGGDTEEIEARESLSDDVRNEFITLPPLLHGHEILLCYYITSPPAGPTFPRKEDVEVFEKGFYWEATVYKVSLKSFIESAKICANYCHFLEAETTH